MATAIDTRLTFPNPTGMVAVLTGPAVEYLTGDQLDAVVQASYAAEGGVGGQYRVAHFEATTTGARLTYRRTTK